MTKSESVKAGKSDISNERTINKQQVSQKTENNSKMRES